MLITSLTSSRKPKNITEAAHSANIWRPRDLERVKSTIDYSEMQDDQQTWRERAALSSRVALAEINRQSGSTTSTTSNRDRPAQREGNRRRNVVIRHKSLAG